MTITVLLYLGLAALAAKFLWNLAVPYRLAVRPYRGDPKKTDSIDFEFRIDVLLIIVNMFLILGNDDDSLPGSKWGLIIGCMVLPVVSLIHFLILGFFCGWIKATLCKGEKPR